MSRDERRLYHRLRQVGMSPLQAYAALRIRAPIDTRPMQPVAKWLG